MCIWFPAFFMFHININSAKSPEGTWDLSWCLYLNLAQYLTAALQHNGLSWAWDDPRFGSLAPNWIFERKKSLYVAYPQIYSTDATHYLHLIGIPQLQSCKADCIKSKKIKKRSNSDWQGLCRLLHLKCRLLHLKFIKEKSKRLPVHENLSILQPKNIPKLSVDIKDNIYDIINPIDFNFKQCLSMFQN